MKSMYITMAAVGVALASPALFAHGNEPHAAPHGGQIGVAGAYHLELVVVGNSKEARDNPLVVYVTDPAGAKLSTVGAGGTATILAGKVKSTASLAPDGDNRLKGKANYASTPDMKVVVSLTLSGKAPVQARFTPLAKSNEH